MVYSTEPLHHNFYQIEPYSAKTYFDPSSLTRLRKCSVATNEETHTLHKQNTLEINLDSSPKYLVTLVIRLLVDRL